MRSRARRCVSSYRASSSGVVLGIFLFFPIAFLQQAADLSNLLMDVAEESHDSRHVAEADRRFDARIVAQLRPVNKTRFETRLKTSRARTSGPSIPSDE